MVEKPVLRDFEIEECLRQIAQARERLGSALQEARRSRSFNLLQWRDWVGRYPAEATLGAVALGFVLAAPGSSRPSADGGSILDDLSRAGLETALRLAMSSLL